METVRKVRRVETVRVDKYEDYPLLLSDYLKNIVGDLYMTVNEFEGENYIHIRRFYTDRGGNLRPRKDGCSFTINQIPMLLETMGHIESRYWAMDERLSLRPFEQFVGPWKFNVDILETLAYSNITTTQRQVNSCLRRKEFHFSWYTTDRWQGRYSIYWNVSQFWNP